MIGKSLMRETKQLINGFGHKVAHGCGVDYYRYTAANVPGLRRARIIDALGITTVLDVGAHDGGYGCELRGYGYRGRILSFEPLREPFHKLCRRARVDPWNWTAQQIGLGDRHETMTIHVSGHPSSSSLLNMTSVHINACPKSAYIDEEQIRVQRLDATVSTTEIKGPIFLKIDVQGYEDAVLRGAGQVLKQVDFLEIEVSYRPLYSGQVLFDGIHQLLAQAGFRFAGNLDSMLSPLDGSILQSDALFIRNI